jgi:glyoxylase-like metal-dependent hydrolase (beta-lactamase superfamily II)
VPREAWKPHRRWLTHDGLFQPDLGCFAVRSPDGVALIDAGIGPGPVPYLGDARGTLRESFAELGLTFGDVSAVIFTHLHFDHVGWASTPDASGTMRPSFSRARYFVGETEWAFWERGPTNTLVYADAGGRELVAKADGRATLRRGEMVRLVADAGSLHFFDAATEARL